MNNLGVALSIPVIRQGPVLFLLLYKEDYLLLFHYKNDCVLSQIFADVKFFTALVIKRESDHLCTLCDE